jgi:excisionase family DNA binding protein
MATPASDPLDADIPDVSLLTVGEVAAALRVSRMTVYRLIHAGEITAIRVGRSVRVSAASLRSFFNGRRPSGRPVAPRVHITIVRDVDVQRP